MSLICGRYFCVCVCVPVYRDSLVPPLAGQVQRRECVVVCGVDGRAFTHQQVDQLGLAWTHTQTHIQI